MRCFNFKICNFQGTCKIFGSLSLNRQSLVTSTSQFKFSELKFLEVGPKTNFFLNGVAAFIVSYDVTQSKKYVLCKRSN